MHTPLDIVAHLPHGICHGRPWGTSLDGLLSSVIWHRQKAAAAAAGSHLAYDPAIDPDDLELPLARCTLAPTWHWMCTFADLNAATPHPDVRIRTSRTDLTDLHRLSPDVSSNVSDVRGRYRHRTIPSMATVTATATWRAVGDADRITELLGDLTSIGKHRNTGEGLVTRWTVTAAPGDDVWSAGHEHQPGILGRTTPTQCLEHRPGVVHGGQSRHGVRAPYMHPSRHTWALLPAR